MVTCVCSFNLNHENETSDELGRVSGHSLLDCFTEYTAVSKLNRVIDQGVVDIQTHWALPVAVDPYLVAAVVAHILVWTYRNSV